MSASHLLDVNVVIALLDPLHVHHDRAHRWFETGSERRWHTCPTVQNGVVRVVSNPKYPNSQPASVVAHSLGTLIEHARHEFLADSISLLDPAVDPRRLLSSAQVTDAYLLHLARTAGARLATFDRRIATSAVRDAADTLALIP